MTKSNVFIFIHSITNNYLNVGEKNVQLLNVVNLSNALVITYYSVHIFLFKSCTYNSAKMFQISKSLQLHLIETEQNLTIILYHTFYITIQ